MREVSVIIRDQKLGDNQEECIIIDVLSIEGHVIMSSRFRADTVTLDYKFTGKRHVRVKEDSRMTKLADDLARDSYG